MTPERDRPSSFVNEVPEDAEARRVLRRSFADDLAEMVAERKPVVRRDRLKFTVRIESLLRHVMQKVDKPWRLHSCARRKDGPHACRFVVTGCKDVLAVAEEF